MSRKTILAVAPLGLGALVLLWAAMAARGTPEEKPGRPAAKKPAAPKTAAAPHDAPLDAPAPATYVSPTASSPASGGGEYAVIEERIRKMEEKLLALETKRTAILASNQELEKQLTEKQAEASARMMAEYRVRAWEQLLGLSETQKQSLIELCSRWWREDGGRPASRDTWLQREVDLRSRLSAEQAAKLHDSAANQSQQMWNYMGKSIGSMVGATKDEQTRFQQTLGDWRPPNAMLLPEGYGADWPGMMKEGAARLQPVLSSDQLARLSRYVQK